MIKVLFVCLGNICRSPMAEAVFRDMVQKKGRSDQFEIDSAGTDGYNELCHAGIHPKTQEILKAMHVPFQQHYARRIRQKDYLYYDYILTMDQSNMEDLQFVIGPDTARKVHRLLDFTKNPRDIKDPWYTGNFDETYWDVVDGCEAFLTYLDENCSDQEKTNFE